MSHSKSDKKLFKSACTVTEGENSQEAIGTGPRQNDRTSDDILFISDF